MNKYLLISLLIIGCAKEDFTEDIIPPEITTIEESVSTTETTTPTVTIKEVTPYSHLPVVLQEAFEDYVIESTKKIHRVYDIDSTRIKTISGEHFIVWYDSLQTEGLHNAVDVLKWSEISYNMSIEMGMNEPLLSNEYLMNVYIDNTSDDIDDFNEGACQCAFSEDPLGTNWSNQNRDRLPVSAYPYNYSDFEYNYKHSMLAVPHETYHMMQMNSEVTGNIGVYDQHSWLVESTASWFQRHLFGFQEYEQPWKGAHGYPAQHMVPHQALFHNGRYTEGATWTTDWSEGVHKYNQMFWWAHLVNHGYITPNDISDLFNGNAIHRFVDGNGYKAINAMENIQNKIGVDKVKKAFREYVQSLLDLSYLENDEERAAFKAAEQDVISAGVTDNRWAVDVDSEGRFIPSVKTQSWGIMSIRFPRHEYSVGFGHPEGVDMAIGIKDEGEYTYLYVGIMDDNFDYLKEYEIPVNATKQ